MKKITLTTLIFFLLSGLLLSACGSPAALSGTSWKLVSFGPLGKQTPAVAGIETSLAFGTDGVVNGFMGCNGFGGNYEVKGATIVFSQIISSMMACQGPQMDQERVVLKLMNGTVRFELHGNSLVLYSADGASTITLSK